MQAYLMSHAQAKPRLYLVSNSLRGCLLYMRNVFRLIARVAIPVQLLHAAQPHPYKEERHALSTYTAKSGYHRSGIGQHKTEL